jgi:glucoamylase
MPRDIPIGNGCLLAAFDFDYRIRDFYYPRVGKENHALGWPSRFGVWVDGAFSWLDGQAWNIHLDYLPDTLVTDVSASHAKLPVRLRFNDVIDYEKNVLVRRVRVTNLAQRDLQVRLFFHSDLNVLENEIGDTIFFDPKNDCLVHYKGPRYFMTSCMTPTALGVTEYAVGGKRHKGLEGTWRDAEDGVLGRNPIAQGAVDSVIGIHLSVPPRGEQTCHYWMSVGTTYHEVESLHRLVIQIGPEQLIDRNTDYWRHWVSAGKKDFHDLPAPIVNCYQRSLLILRTQIDRGGAVIAANDTDIWQFNLDTYSYMWPRDGAITAQTLDRAGYGGLTRQFLEFCTQKIGRYNYSASILSDTGFLMHKYNPDGSVGSSWHPWSRNEEMMLPIQEDETALVLWTIGHHYALHRDIEAIRPFYASFVVGAADFLLAFRDERTGLPLPSYDLWEERRGVFTFTIATVIAGLQAASKLAVLFHEEQRAEAYARGAAEVKAALEQHLYCAGANRFARGIVFEDGLQRRDPTLDASLFGLVLFGGYDPWDAKVEQTLEAAARGLWVKEGIGGMARYAGDEYQRTAPRPGIPGNPWIVCTLWLAQYRIARARDLDALREAVPLLEWVAQRALPSGVLPEQVHPETGDYLSVSPLTWSHATFVAAVLDYVEKAEILQRAQPRKEWPGSLAVIEGASGQRP